MRPGKRGTLWPWTGLVAVFFCLPFIPSLMLARFMPALALAGIFLLGQAYKAHFAIRWYSLVFALLTTAAVVTEMLSLADGMLYLLGATGIWLWVEGVGQSHRQALLDLRTRSENKHRELAQIRHATAMQARHHAGYQRRLKTLYVLYETAKKILRQIELQPILQELELGIEKMLPEHFENETAYPVQCAIYLPTDNQPGFKREWEGGNGYGRQKASSWSWPEVLTQEQLRSWTGADYRARRITEAPRGQEGRPVSLIVVPMTLNDIVIGLIGLSAESPGEFSMQDYRQCVLFSKQIYIALRKALLYRRIQRLSFTDSHTGLYVQRYFKERLFQELQRAKRYRQPLSLIMLDIDFFKRINDQYLHAAGDRVLKLASDRIKQHAGSTALVARYGGEEFAVLLPNTDKLRAIQIAESIREAVRREPIPLHSGEAARMEPLQVAITLSGGVACYPEDAQDEMRLATAADEALYAAKRSGRDRIVVAWKKD